MRKTFRNLIFVLILAITASCSTDFDVNADWEDITVVFGLINPDDTAHYIKINKAFLGDEDAYAMADRFDSLYYDTIIVNVEQWTNGEKIASFPLIETLDEFPKNDGVFSNEHNVLYKFKADLKRNSVYKLNIFVPSYNKNVTSTAELIGPLTIRGNFNHELRKINLSGSDKLELLTAENARIYDVKLRFHYYETYDEITFTEDSIDWTLPSKVSSSVDGMDEMEIDINGESFLKLLNANLEEDPAIMRIARSSKYDGQDPGSGMLYTGAVDVFISMGGDDLYTYIQVNKPSNGIVQEKPAFTNISNGIGLFSSRSTHTVLAKELSESTLDSLCKGIFTKKLNFRDQYGNYSWD